MGQTVQICFIFAKDVVSCAFPKAILCLVLSLKLLTISFDVVGALCHQFGLRRHYVGFIPVHILYFGMVELRIYILGY